ncbi:MAG TPA: hypothetical protein VK092_09740 [Deinococcales bacterium]|nr:hypothetical protein [Deinococcales bacterium]
MQEKLLYGAAGHYRRGRELEADGHREEALQAWQAALRDLHAVAPQRMRDILLAQVYLACHIASRTDDPEGAATDLRLGYSYARTTRDTSVRQLAEDLWREQRETRRAQPLE